MAAAPMAPVGTSTMGQGVGAPRGNANPVHLPGRMRSTSATELVQEGDMLTRRADLLDQSSYQKWHNKQVGGGITDAIKSVAIRTRANARYGVASMKCAFGDSSSGRRQFVDFGAPYLRPRGPAVAAAPSMVTTEQTTVTTTAGPVGQVPL